MQQTANFYGVSIEGRAALNINRCTTTVVRHSKTFSTFLEENVSLTCCSADI